MEGGEDWGSFSVKQKTFLYIVFYRNVSLVVCLITSINKLIRIKTFGVTMSRLGGVTHELNVTIIKLPNKSSISISGMPDTSSSSSCSLNIEISRFGIIS